MYTCDSSSLHRDARKSQTLHSECTQQLYVSIYTHFLHTTYASHVLVFSCLENYAKYVFSQFNFIFTYVHTCKSTSELVVYSYLCIHTRNSYIKCIHAVNTVGTYARMYTYTKNIACTYIHIYVRPRASTISLVRPKYCQMIIIVYEEVDLHRPIK